MKEIDKKYKGVKNTFGEHPLLEIVPFYSAQRLFELGYHSKDMLLWDEDKRLQPLNTKSLYPAPTLYEAKIWLEKTYGIIINVFSQVEDIEEDNHHTKRANGKWMRSIYDIRKNGTRVKNPVLPFETESDALSMSIKEVLHYIKSSNYEPIMYQL